MGNSQTMTIRRADVAQLAGALPALLGFLQGRGINLPEKDLQDFLKIAKALESDTTSLDVIVKLKKNRTARFRLVVR